MPDASTLTSPGAAVTLATLSVSEIPVGVTEEPTPAVIDTDVVCETSIVTPSIVVTPVALTPLVADVGKSVASGGVIVRHVADVSAPGSFVVATVTCGCSLSVPALRMIFTLVLIPFGEIVSVLLEPSGFTTETITGAFVPFGCSEVGICGWT